MRARLLRNLPVPLLAAAAIAILIAAGASLARLTMAPAATPFPVPIYEIEAQSGSCNASILNLGIGYVGALEAPVPVDVDCDLLPDILVAVNLVDIEGPINDPLATDSTTYSEFIQERGAATIAPNIEFNRYPVNVLSTILKQPPPPLRINIVLTITDLEGEEPDTEIRFGYDTGEGGSIPTHFKALVRGLDNFFNPLEAVVDTKGDLQGGDTVPTYYEGPLTLIGGIRTDEGAFDTSLELEYSPWPDVVRVGYASDDAGHHIDYEHGVGELLLLGYGTVLAEDGTFEHYVPGELPEVDVETRMNVLDHADTLDLTAAIDRMPRQIGIDIKTTPDGSGRLDWEATTDGRLPDARVDLVSRTSGVVTTRAEALIEELPPELHALWALEEDNDIEALFTTSDPDAEGFDLDTLGEGPGIGAIEVLYSNVEQTAFAPHIPTQQQFLNMQTQDGEQLVTGRVERIRGLSFSSDRFGVDVNSRIGDGALPLEANIEIDGLPLTGQLLDANATLFPLPSSIDLSMVTPDEESPDPFEIVLDSSHTIDIQAHAELRESYAAEALCGEPGTLCTDLGVHHVPAHIAVSMSELETAEGDGSTTDINIDLVPREGAAKPDVLLDAVMGKDDSLDDPDAVEAAGPVVFEASAELRGIPENIRLHFEEGSDETLSALDLSTCDLTTNETCLGVSDTIESVEVLVRNFREEERDEADVPHPSSVAPQYATVAARGLDDPGKEEDPVVRFEAAGRIKDITEIRYANVEGLFGVRSVIGDNRDLEVVLDIKNVIFGGDEEEPEEPPEPPEEEEEELGPIDLLGRILVSPLPGEIDLCLREAGKDLSLSHPAPFTDICESGDPFGDASVTETPMTLAYDANTPFDVLANVDFTSHGEDPGVEDNHDIHAKVDITAVPSDLTAHIQMPPDVEGDDETEETERMRILAHAPGATNTNIEYTFQDRLGGALCADPQPVDDITCIEGTIDSLSDWMSILVDTGPGEDDIAAKVFACDLNITTGDCNTDTEGDIDKITARARLVTGDPEEEGDLVPFVLEEHPYVDDFTRNTAHVLALRMDQDDGDNLELNAEAVLTNFRSISFSKAADGFDVRTDLGDGVKPLLASVGMDTRFPASAVPPDDCPEDFDPEERPECVPPEPGDLLLADARVLPLPEVITISQSGPVEDDEETVADESQPMEIGYTSTAPVDVEARLQQFGQVAGDLCGDHGTLCATLQLDRLPTEISATIDEFDEGLGGTDVRRMMTVDIDAIPFGDVAPPDMVIDAMIGAAPDDVPPIVHDDTPLIAHAEINGFLQEAGIYFGQTGELLDDGSLKDAELEQVGFVSCELDFDVSPPACTTTPTPIREVGVAVRNFHERPTDFPVPTRTNTPAEDTLDCDPNNLNDDPGTSELMYAEAVMRGDDLEAHAGFTCINEFRMISVDDVLGVDVRAGDGQGLEVHGDIAGMTLGDDKPISDQDEVDLGFAEDLEAAENVTVLKRQTLTADVLATLSNVPTHVSFCMRSDGAEFPDSPIGTLFTAPCEDQHPFSDEFFEAAPPEDAPMSVAYRANDVIDDITTVATVRIDRALFVPVEIFGIEVLFPAGSLPPMNIFGDVNIEKLPENLTVHFETPAENKDDEAPEDEGGPIRALFYYDDSDSFGDGTNLVNIDFNAKYTLGNAVCRDLREGKVAYCFKGRLENLPARVKAYIDPEAELFNADTGDLTQNLKIDAFSTVAPTDSLNLTGLDISVVKDDDPTKEPLILVATGDITGLPQSIRGTIHMKEEAAEGEPDPNDAPAFLVEASPPLEHLDVVVRNFIAPDPLPDVAAPRADRFGNAHDPDQEIIFIGRGPDFKAIIDIKDVSGGGYRTGRNAAGEATETHLINVGFGIPGTSEKPTIRAYVDMLDRDDEGNPTAIFGEVFLDDVPYGIDVCFRGEVDEIPVEPNPDDYDGGVDDPDYVADHAAFVAAEMTYVNPLAAPGTETECDTYLHDHDADESTAPVEAGLERHLGGFLFEGLTDSDANEKELDVDAFFRMAQGSDTNVLKAFADVDDIPNTVKGSFGDGAISVEMFKADGETKASIGEVFAEMADYDFYDETPDPGFNSDGYGAHPPWGFRVPGNATLPPRQPATQDASSGPSGHEFARAALNDDNFHVQARIGKDKDGGPGLTLTSFIMDPSVCPVPEQAHSYFPHYPVVDEDEDGTNDNAYTCIRGELLPSEDDDPDDEDPLLLDADLVLDGMPLKIRDAGLTDVPQFFQITLAETETLEGEHAKLRDRCAPAADEGATLNAETDSFEGGNTDCMPPMIHFDSEGDAQLFARLMLGEGSDNSGDLGELRTRTPYDTMPDMEALPVPPAVRPGSDQFSQLNHNTGVLAKVGQFQDVVINGQSFPPIAEPVGPQRTAVRAAIRLDIPKALTIDQVQQWSAEDKTSDANYRAMKDMRFHYVFRDSDGSDEPQIVTTLGDLAVMVHDFRTGGQVLVSNENTDTRGVPIPGDFGIDLYERDFKGRGRMLIQADVRSSSDLGARVRLYSGLVDGLGDSDFKLSGLKGFGTDDSYLEDLEKPTFRIRAEIKGEPEKVPQPGGGGGGDDGDDWKDALLCIVWCLATDVGAPEINAQLNLAPNPGTPTRMLEAAISMKGTKIGAELQGYANIEGTSFAEFSADSPDSGADPFAQGGISVDISPLNVFLHAGVPILASFDMLLLSEGAVDLNIAPTDNFRLMLNTTVMRGRTNDPYSVGGESWLQIGLEPGFLQAYLSIFWPFPPIYLNYGITAGPAIPLVFNLCSPVPASPVPWVYPIGSADLLVTAFLPAPWTSFTGHLPTAPLFTYGTLQPILDPIIWGLGPSILCLALPVDDIEGELFTDKTPHVLNDSRTPGDPIVQPDHPIPGLVVSQPPDPADPHPSCVDDVDNDGDGDTDEDDTDCQSGGSEDAGLDDLVVESGDTLTLCGTQVFQNITIEDGATINVATSANDDGGTPFVDCPADPPPPTEPDEPDPLPNLGHLRLIAAGTAAGTGGGLIIDGTINAPAGGGEMTLAGANVTVGSSGVVNGASGLLEINAGLDLNVHGLIQANFVATTMPIIDDPEHDRDGQPWADLSTGNAGASHGGRGSVGTGDDDPGTRGPRYGSGEFNGDEAFPGTETGSPGGSVGATTGTHGNGGGAILLRGSDVTVTGTITANGDRGEDLETGMCQVIVADDPETEEDESLQSTENTGVEGTGGGSGGGIAINGITVDVTEGTLRARGGRGGDGLAGAGGAGGGGVIRLSGGVVDHGLTNNQMDSAVSGGGAGFGECPEYPNSDSGEDGAFEVIESPRSVAFTQADFWFAPSDVEIPYKAALRDGSLTVYLCGIRKGPEDLQTDRYGVVMPTGVPGALTQCGNAGSGENQPQVLDIHHHTDEVVESSFDVNGLEHGVWALWTIAATDDEDIFDFWFDNPSDFCRPFWPFWDDDCIYEPTPSDYQVAIGVDNAKPAFSMSTEGLLQNADDPPKNVTNNPNITINVSGITDRLSSLTDPFPLIEDTSGFAEFCVYLDDGSLAEEFCSTDQEKLEVDLPTDEEEYTIYVVAFDQAGNPSSPMDGDVPDVDTFDTAHRVIVTLDTTPPDGGDADITAPATPDGNNDWYTAPPTEYTISGFDDFGGSGPHPDGAFLYWFDAGDPEACESPCVLTEADGLPGEGLHTLNWRARDAAGHLVPPETAKDENGEVVAVPPHSIQVRIDSSLPESAVTVVPVPEFTGQWITADEPVAVARGVDIFGGSGLADNITDTDCSAADPAATERSGTCISINGTGGPWEAWGGTPVALPNGTGQVICAFSVDDAGNVEAVNASVNCTEPLNIDNALPTGDITIAPDLAGAWYDFDQGVPAITFDNYDATGSSEPGTGGFRYRLDNGPEVGCHDGGNGCSIPVSALQAGSNVLHWTTVDTAGNRSPEERVELLIDLDFPRTYILPAPFAPTGANDWYLERPVITLAAFDQVNPSGPDAPPPPLRPTESGVDAISYSIDGALATYTSPFHVNVGAHQVCVTAADVASNDEPEHCAIFKADLKPPDTTVFENGLNPPTIDGDNGWYRDIPVVITTTATDEANGSDVVPQNFGPNLCDHTPDDNPAPAGICISVDGRAPGASINGPEFGPYDGRTPITLGEGEHVIRAYSVDNAGRRSAMEREIVQIDRSDPVTVARLRAPYASRDGLERPWWRHQPSLVLRGLDGDHNSGIDLIEYRINGGTPQTYTGPVTLPVGKNVVEHRATDASGRVAEWSDPLEVAVDVKPPFIKALKPDPALWLQVKLLGLITFGDNVELNWKLRDDLSGPVHVKVIVYDQFGLAVAHLDSGIHHVTPGQNYFGSTEWDGTTGHLLESLISAGVYYYRVIAYDDAGNVAMSGESKKLLVELKTCLLFC